MSTLDELVMGWGRNANLDDEILESTLRAVLYFALAGTDRQLFVDSAIVGQHFPRIRLARRDVSHGAILVRLLGNEVHPLVRRRTVKCLADLAASPHNQIKIASYFGVLDELVGLLGKAGGAFLQEQTVRCLANLAEAKGNHLTMASFSVLEPLVKLLARDEVPKVHQETARCLTNIAISSPDHTARIAEYPGALDALVKLLTKEEPQAFCIGVVEQTMKCLKILSDLQENLPLKIVTEYPGILAALVQLLGARRTSSTQRLALKLLGSLSYRHQRNKVIVASHPGLLPAVLRLLEYNWVTKGRIKVQVKAAKYLVSLVSDTEPVLETTNSLRIGANKAALKVLVRCMDSRVRIRIVQSLGVECFYYLAIAPENRWKIVSHRGVLRALLNQMVSVANPNGQKQACWCLAKLAETQDIRIFLASRPGVLDALVTVLEKANWVTLEPAITCLASLAQTSSEEKKVKIASHGGVIDAVVRLLKGNFHVHATATELATKCLSHLAMVSDNVEEICSRSGLLGAFVGMLQEEESSDVLLENITSCLVGLACSSNNKGRIGSFPGMLEALIPFLGPRGESRKRVQEYIVSCLSRLSVAPANQVKLRSYSITMDALRSLAKADGATSTKEEAASCLGNLMSKHRRSSGYLESNSGLLSPAWHEDPLTWELMCDPVKCNDGFTYDRWTIIDNDIQKSPFVRGTEKFVIACDDLNVRRRVFRLFPERVTNFRSRRQEYRERALESSNALQFQVAIEMLNNVLQWDPSDTKCQNELTRILSLLPGQSPHHAQPPEWIMSTGTPDSAQSPRVSIDAGVEPDVSEVRTPRMGIPVVDHIYVSQTRNLWKHGREICVVAVLIYFGSLLVVASLRSRA